MFLEDLSAFLNVQICSQQTGSVCVSFKQILSRN